MRISDWSSDVCSSDLDEAASFGVPAFVVGADIGEVGKMRAPTIDLPRDAGRAWRPGSIEDRQIGIVQNAPDRAGMRKPFLGTAEGERAGFGPAIMFEDDGPPPVDHCFLEMRRTGRRAMHDEAEDRKSTRLNSSH